MIFGVPEQCPKWKKEQKLPRIPQLLTDVQPKQPGPRPGLRRPVLRRGRVLDGSAGRLEPDRDPQRGPRALHVAARRGGQGHGGRNVGHSGYYSRIQYLDFGSYGLFNS